MKAYKVNLGKFAEIKRLRDVNLLSDREMARFEAHEVSKLEKLTT